MKQTMISLVSEQRMQNIIPFFQQGLTYDSLHLIRSSDADIPGSRFERAWKDTENTLASKVGVISADKSVDAYNITETRQLIKDIISKGGSQEKFTVNFTGGTKCMSIGAFQAAQDTQTNSLYVDTQNEKLVWFTPDGQKSENDFSLDNRLNISIYLKSNGKEVDEQKTTKRTLTERDLSTARRMIEVWPQPVITMEKLRKDLTNADKKPKIINRFRENEVTRILAEYCYIRSEDQNWLVNSEDEKFITGGWFEALVFVLIHKNSHFNDVKSNVGIAGGENELDVAVTRNGQFAFVECKSGKLKGSEPLDKIQAIRSKMGTFTGAFVATTSKTKEITDSFRDRAKLYRINEIITFEQILDIGDLIEKKMRAG